MGFFRNEDPKVLEKLPVFMLRSNNWIAIQKCDWTKSCNPVIRD